jgi:uncharacterized protein YuzE
MKITLDRRADAVYILLASSFDDADVVKTYLCDPIEVDGQINLDFDVAGHLVGIEILDASHKLPPELLKEAEIME